MSAKFRMANKEYRDINKGIVEWIIGLTIAELVLVISQNLYSFNLIFYFFISISFVSILLAVVIMYVVVSSVDSELYTAILAVKTEGKMTKKDFEIEYEKRLGKFTELLINLLFQKKAYKYLFISFALNTIGMVILIIFNIKNLR